MLIDEVIRIADEYKGKTILVGLSGGADSVCLTHALKSAGFSVAAAHVNHSLRGDESDGDEEFVKEFCKKLDIPLFIKKADVKKTAKENGRGLEDEGRIVRYGFFESVDIPGKVIATAHNKGDFAETVFLNLLRGSGGLRGIPEREGIIRPLINVSRSEIEEYCKDNNLSFRTDSSNLSTDYTRNKIRLDIIPKLREINPSVEDAIMRAAEINKLDRDVVESFSDLVPFEKKGDRWYAKYTDMPDGVALRVIRRLYSKVYGSERNLSFENVKSALELVKSGKTGKFSELGSGIYLETVYGGFLVGRLPEIKKFSYPLKDVTTIAEADLVLNVTVSDKAFGKVSLNSDLIGNVTARSRIPGDRICLNGFTKKLKDVFIDRKIPLEERDKAVVLESGGCILGVIGIGFDSKFLANDKTVKFFNLDWRKYNEGCN